MVTASGASRASAVGTASGSRMAKVPQEDPVAKDTAAPARNTSSGSRPGGSEPLSRSATYAGAPSASPTSDSVQASTSVTATVIMPPMPDR